MQSRKEYIKQAAKITAKNENEYKELVNKYRHYNVNSLKHIIKTKGQNQ